jgi:hypothetical protein
MVFAEQRVQNERRGELLRAHVERLGRRVRHAHAQRDVDGFARQQEARHGLDGQPRRVDRLFGRAREEAECRGDLAPGICQRARARGTEAPTVPTFVTATVRTSSSS